MFNGDTTICRLDKDMNGKPCSKPTKVLWNVQFTSNIPINDGHDIIEWGCMVIYMDDIMNFSNDLDVLEKFDKDVLRQLKKNDLYLKLMKSEFKKTKVEYLGMVISEGKMSMDLVKLKGIWDWPAPTSMKEVWSFIGFGKFYRKFINKISKLAAPLNEKGQDVWLDTRMSEILQYSETMIYSWTCHYDAGSILTFPDQSRHIEICIWSSPHSNGDRHPVAFFFKTFNDMERNYEIYNRELLGVIQTLEEWWHYIQGSGHTTIIMYHSQIILQLILQHCTRCDQLEKKSLAYLRLLSCDYIYASLPCCRKLPKNCHSIVSL